MGNPTVTPFTENRHDGGYIVWEPSNGIVTREEIVLAADAGAAFLQAGTVLGRIGNALVGVAAAQGANTGNPTFGAIAVGAPAVAGVYVLRMQDATHYVVENPEGEQIGHGVAGAAFDAGGLSFTLTAGGVAAVPGDSFTITVAPGSGKYVILDPDADDGSAVAAAILFGGRQLKAAADVKAVANVRGPMRVNGSELIWPPGISGNAKAAAIAQLDALPGGGIRVT